MSLETVSISADKSFFYWVVFRTFKIIQWLIFVNFTCGIKTNIQWNSEWLTKDFFSYKLKESVKILNREYKR